MRLLLKTLTRWKKNWKQKPARKVKDGIKYRDDRPQSQNQTGLSLTDKRFDTAVDVLMLFEA